MLRRSLWVVGVLVVVGFAYYLGYNQGSEDREAELDDAVIIASSLAALRSHREAEALEQLETQLDNHVLSYAVLRDRLSVRRILFGDPDTTFMWQISKYRQKVPTKISDPASRQIIERTVEEAQKAALKPRD
jgi:hypothetical protein